MTLPLSGQLGMSQINSELGRSSTSQISLDAAENGDYATINRFSSARPDAANPAAISEWYGYNHRASPPTPTWTPLPEVGYAGNASTGLFWLDQACRNSILRPGRYWGDDSGQLVVTAPAGNLYSNSAGTTRPPAGYYAQFGVEAVYWNGSTATRLEVCRI